MARRPTFKPSLAETKRANQAALDFMRVASYREDAPRIDVGATAKRDRAAPAGILERDVLRAGLQLLRVHPLVAWASRINSGAVENANGQFVRFNQIAGCSDIVGQMIGPYHQYPDGAVLFLGTLFAPVEDRDTAGKGFTHKLGDVVTVSSPELGMLANRMTTSDKAAPWTYGASHLMRNLAKRGLL
jgi:hypothetical protein